MLPITPCGVRVRTLRLTVEIAQSEQLEVIEQVDSLNEYGHSVGGLPVHVRTAMTGSVADSGDDVPDLDDLMRVEVEAQPPPMGGWRAVARRGPDGQLQGFLGEQCPAEVVAAPLQCDHCGYADIWQATFVLRNRLGVIRQIGDACLLEVTGSDCRAALDHWLLVTQWLVGLVGASDPDAAPLAQESEPLPVAAPAGRPLGQLALAAGVLIATGVAWLLSERGGREVAGDDAAAAPAAARPVARMLSRFAWERTHFGGRAPAAAVVQQAHAAYREGATREILYRLLRRLQNARTAPAIDEVLARIAAGLADFEAPLLAVLEEPEHQLVHAAIEVVGRLGVEVAAPALTALVRSPDAEVRAAALVASARLGRVWNAAAERFMATDDPRQIAAGIAAVDPSAEDAAALLSPFLSHPDANVRRAAQRGLMHPAIRIDREALLEVAASGGLSAARLAAIEVLALKAAEEPIETALLELLVDADPAVRRAVLAVLAGAAAGDGARDSRVADRLLDVVVAEDGTRRQALMAFVAIERRGAVPVPRIRALLPDLDPMLRALAARCLVVAGESSGLDVAVAVLAEEPRSEDDDELQYARHQAHAVLVEVSGEDYGDDVAAWRHWRERFDRPLASGPLSGQAPLFW